MTEGMQAVREGGDLGKYGIHSVKTENLKIKNSNLDLNLEFFQ